jgi:hypothetical protein
VFVDFCELKWKLRLESVLSSWACVELATARAHHPRAWRCGAIRDSTGHGLDLTIGVGRSWSLKSAHQPTCERVKV